MDETSICKWEDGLDFMKNLFSIKNDWDEFERMVGENSQPGSECTKLLISCRLHLFSSNRLKVLKRTLKMKECNLHSNECCLTESEKSELFAMYVKSCNLVDINTDMHFFPLLCRMAFDKSEEGVKHLFNQPVEQLVADIESLFYRNKHHFCCITLCVLFESGFDISWLENLLNAEDKIPKLATQVIKLTCQNLDINMEGASKNSSIKKIMEGLNLLMNSYLKSDGGNIRYIIHDKVYDYAATICGSSENMFGLFLNHSTSKFISERYTTNKHKSNLIFNMKKAMP